MRMNYDDSKWDYAVSFESVWGKLRERSIPQLGGAMISKIKPIKTGMVKNMPKIYNVQLGFLFDTSIRGGAFAYTYIYSPKEQDITLGFDEESARGTWKEQDITPLGFAEERWKRKSIWFNGEGLKLDKDENVASRQIVSVHCQKGWNKLFMDMGGFWGYRFDFSMSLLSGNDLLVSATKEKEEPDTFFTTDILTDDALIQDVASHYEEPSKAGVSWRKFISPCNNIALAMSWEDIEEKPLSSQSLPLYLKEGECVLLDFGREVFGCPIVSLEASEGSVVDMGYAEHLTDGRINPARGLVWYADRYITKSGGQSWELFSSRAFRYLEIVVRKAGHPVKLNGLKVKEVLYPVEDIGSFECSDKLLNKVWNMGKYTVHLCMEDAYIDCPWRERGQWWGDARVTCFANRVAFGDERLFARGIRQIGTSQLEDGRMHPVYPETIYDLLQGKGSRDKS
ncbi:hypothetical protein ES703_122510 [subsurface metagenome]